MSDARRMTALKIHPDSTGTGTGCSGDGSAGGGPPPDYGPSGGYGSGVGPGDDSNYVSAEVDASVQVTDARGLIKDIITIVPTPGPDPSGQEWTETNGQGSLFDLIVTASRNNDDSNSSVGMEPQSAVVVGGSPTLEEITVTASKPEGGKVYTFLFGPSAPISSTSFTPSRSAKVGSAAYYASIPSALNPATVPIKSSGNTISFFYDEDGADGAGHISWSLNGSAAIGLTSTNATVTGPGFASIGIDNDITGGTVDYGTGSITVAEAQALQAQALALENASIQEVNNPASNALVYNLATNNCAEWTSSSVSAAGIADSLPGGIDNAVPGVVWTNIFVEMSLSGTLLGGGKFKP